ncbi:thiosulfate sulfurtransferase GlpE [Dasania sp. GY-MA-18]|uniref:Thiosulfate sulfurtransferase GlpE n=1 Tax=Dasania phycosphaerae TaxID=2950436 RepID=A0A9J6RQE1_9GAMM|nr:MULTISPECIES: thiosulfate sulfurtransferase GlpE [Dasania]MCR8923950.1 thiosulfate sulfurtransferase GlpE [Dasania sp. GY-MA-18]MCZ0866384.1 thiosulfate sulfurtransferase GlpE [Dasania phycosphaerae]MCZ0870108.1 thiosulfate sulfurtransferase GlpE [Dasania phycosphaerae]
MTFKRLSISDSKTLLDEQDATLVDIRDQASFISSHIERAIHIDNNNVQAFIQQQDHSKPLVVYCYHGNSSQGAADFFASQGFSEVYSMDGGFEEWRTQYATVTES